MSTDDWFSVYDSEEDEEEELSEEDQELISRIDKLHYSGDKGIRDAWDLLKDKDSNSIEFLWECCHYIFNFLRIVRNPNGCSGNFYVNNLKRKTRSNCSMYGQFRAGSELGDQPEKRKEFATRALTFAEELIRRAPKLNHGHRYKGFYFKMNSQN